ncbi:MAG TPA: pyrroline-5-carboxylate reductase [Thermoanaerobacterales bacterium]|nr:pyrroline-5-carboxylate reductase [Thermoanaerobacterales bacterium]
MLEDQRIGFIGAGSIAQAMISGLLSTDTIKPGNIYITNKSGIDKLSKIKDIWDVNITTDKSFLIKNVDIIILAVKPKDVRDALKEIKDFITDSHLIITLAAGVSTDLIRSILGDNVKLIRAMPNTSCIVKESATALALGRGVGAQHEDIAREIFASIGKVIFVEEMALDAVTGLSGSGPAYVYYMIEAMEEAGIQMGLTKEVSRVLAEQTVLGAAKTLMETGGDPAELRREVTTPGGTTFAGISVLEQSGFKESLIKAIVKAAQRSKELGKEM